MMTCICGQGVGRELHHVWSVWVGRKRRRVRVCEKCNRRFARRETILARDGTPVRPFRFVAAFKSRRLRDLEADLLPKFIEDVLALQVHPKPRRQRGG